MSSGNQATSLGDPATESGGRAMPSHNLATPIAMATGNLATPPLHEMETWDRNSANATEQLVKDPLSEDTHNQKYRYFIMKTKLMKLLIPEHWTLVGEIDSEYICEDESLLRIEEMVVPEVLENVQIKMEEGCDVGTVSCVEKDDGALEAFGNDVKSEIDNDGTIANPSNVINEVGMLTLEAGPGVDHPHLESSDDDSRETEVVHTIYPSPSHLQDSERHYSNSGKIPPPYSNSSDRSRRIRKPSTRFSGQLMGEWPSDCKAVGSGIVRKKVGKKLKRVAVKSSDLVDTKREKPVAQARPTGSRVCVAEHKCAKCGKCFQSLVELRQHCKAVHNVDREVSKNNRMISLVVNENAGSDEAEDVSAIHGPLLSEELRVEMAEKSVPDLAEVVWTTSVVGEREVVVSKRSCMRSLLKDKLTTFSCGVCGALFADQKQRHQHRLQKHRTNSNVPCTACGKRFSSSGSLVKHVRRVHWKVPFKGHACHVCGKTVRDKSYLTRHIRVVHTETENKWTCDICGLKLKTEVTLKVHQRIHTGEKPHTCQTCGAAFRKRVALRLHEMIHSGERPHVCEECGKSYRCSSELRKHKTNVHELKHRTHVHELTEQSYDCRCGESFPARSALYRHRRLKHGIGTCICEICGKELAGRRSLEFHKRTHTGEKPFVCKVCGSAYISESSLKVHGRIHTGEKPYSCDVCHKKFFDSKSLSSHRHTHIKEKRFECPKCYKRFQRPTSLNAHKKRSCKLRDVIVN